jgi:hypothetical protein
MRTRSLFSRLTLASILAMSLGACAVRGHAWVSTPGVIVVEERPPPPRREVVVVKSGYIWVDGHWEQTSGRWVWRDGYHQRARSDADWAPGRWERRGRGHAWVSGTWKVKVKGKGRGQRGHYQDHR